jgi:CDP-diglyceride synthetase
MKLDPTAYRSVVYLLLAVASILMLPWLAMHVTDQVVWSLADFALAGALLLGTGLLYGLLARKADPFAYRAAVAVGLVAALLLVWINLAVGIIGDEEHSANAMYVGVLAVGIIGAFAARFQPHGMARAFFVTALAQASVTLIAVAFRLGSPASGPLELLAVNGFFVAAFLGAALLFRKAAHGTPLRRK